MACFVCLEQLPARPLIFSFGSGATFGRRLFRHAVPGVFLIRRVSCGLFCVPGTFRRAVPGCFPDLKGVLWPVLCAWNNCLPLDFFIRFRSDVWPGQRDGSRRARVYS